MAIAFGTAGAVATGTTSLNIAYPTGIAAGDLLVMVAASKYPSTSFGLTGGGWLNLPPLGSGLATGGAGTNGIDTGSVSIQVFYKIADGTETGTYNLTNGALNSCVGRMFRYTKGAGLTWSLQAAKGSDNTAGTAWSVTADANPGISAGDMVLACSAINADTYTYSGQAISATGISAWGTVTERQDSGTNSGQDCGLVVSEHPVNTGTASAAPVFTMTASGSATNAPAGATIILRLREVLTVTLPLITETSTLYNPTITPGAVTVTAPLLTNTSTLYAPTISQPAPTQNLTLAFINEGNTLYAPSVAPGPVTLTTPLLTDGDTLYAPTVVPQAVTITAPLLTNTSVLYEPTVRPTQPVSLPLLTNSSTLYTPTVTVGPVTITAPLFTNTSTLFAPALAPQPVTITAPLFTNTSTLFAPAVAPQAVTITTPLFTNSSALYTPVISQGVVTLQLPLLTNTSTLYGPTISRGAVTITTPLIASGAALFAPSVAAGAVTLSLPLIASGAALFAPAIAAGAVTLGMPVITDGDTVYAPALSMKIEMPVLGSTSILYTPTVRIAGQALFIYHNGQFVAGKLKGYDNGQWIEVLVRYNGQWV